MMRSSFTGMQEAHFTAFAHSCIIRYIAIHDPVKRQAADSEVIIEIYLLDLYGSSLFFRCKNAAGRKQSEALTVRLQRALINHTHRLPLTALNLSWANKCDVAGDPKGALHLVAHALFKLH